MQSNVLAFDDSSTDAGCALFRARVKAVADATVVLDTPRGVIGARKAVSCLVAPRAGDLVLASRSGADWHVLAVLEREGPQDLAIEFPADARVHAPNGSLELAARDRASLGAGREARVFGPKVAASGGELALQAKRIDAHAEQLEARAGKARMIAGAIDVVATRVGQKFETVTRWVEKVESLNVGHLVQTVRRSLLSRSEQASITARKDLRFDGERIHMG